MGTRPALDAAQTWMVKAAEAGYPEAAQVLKLTTQERRANHWPISKMDTEPPHRSLADSPITAAMAVIPKAEASRGDLLQDTTPVMSLGFGSRYEAASKTRSDIDEDSDAAVTKALKPIDQFIQNSPRSCRRRKPKRTSLPAGRVPALRGGSSMPGRRPTRSTTCAPSMRNSRSSPHRRARHPLRESRDQVPGLHDGNASSRNGCKSVARRSSTSSKTTATKGAARNNLRAWASLAVGEVGVLNRDRGMDRMGDPQQQHDDRQRFT